MGDVIGKRIDGVAKCYYEPRGDIDGLEGFGRDQDYSFTRIEPNDGREIYYRMFPSKASNERSHYETCSNRGFKKCFNILVEGKPAKIFRIDRKDLASGGDVNAPLDIGWKVFHDKDEKYAHEGYGADMLVSFGPDEDAGTVSIYRTYIEKELPEGVVNSEGLNDSSSWQEWGQAWMDIFSDDATSLGEPDHVFDNEVDANGYWKNGLYHYTIENQENQNWLKKQLNNASKDVESWPEWMKPQTNEILHDNPPPAFNPDYDPDAEKIREIVNKRMEIMEQVEPCESRDHRKERRKKVWDITKAEVKAYNSKQRKIFEQMLEFGI